MSTLQAELTLHQNGESDAGLERLEKAKAGETEADEALARLRKELEEEAEAVRKAEEVKKAAESLTEAKEQELARVRGQVQEQQQAQEAAGKARSEGEVQLADRDGGSSYHEALNRVPDDVPHMRGRAGGAERAEGGAGPEPCRRQEAHRGSVRSSERKVCLRKGEKDS